MIIITGASKGIGKFLFEKFLNQGEKVYGTYNSTKPSSNNLKSYFKVDISNYHEVQNWIKDIEKEMDKVVLINCAGINYNSVAHKADIEKWIEVININLIGNFYVIRSILPIMREQNYGRIINLSSVVPQIGVPGTSAYSASKSALWGLTKSIALENARKGITINNLNLGYFNIGMIKEVPEEFQAKIKEKIPTGNFGDPITIYNVINSLISNDYLNGTSININAGLY